MALALFSLFLRINPSTYVNYLIFLALSYTVLAVYMYTKRSNVYTIADDAITAKRFRKKPIEIQYSNISEMTTAQGRLAKLFHCGTIYIELKEGKGAYRSLGGRSVQAMRDVQDPEKVRELVADKLGPYATV